MRRWCCSSVYHQTQRYSLGFFTYHCHYYYSSLRTLTPLINPHDNDSCEAGDQVGGLVSRDILLQIKVIVSDGCYYDAPVSWGCQLHLSSIRLSLQAFWLNQRYTCYLHWYVARILGVLWNKVCTILIKRILLCLFIVNNGYIKLWIMCIYSLNIIVNTENTLSYSVVRYFNTYQWYTVIVRYKYS